MRNALSLVSVFALSLVLSNEALAQRSPQRTECRPGTRVTRTTTGPSERARAYDVVVDVRDLCVERLTLNVDNVDAHLSLNARVANLVRINAGADVGIGQVDLGIQGIRAEALLLVDLDNVVAVVDRALNFIDENPQIVSQLVGTVGNTVRTAGGVANTALQPGGAVSQAVGAVGQTLNNATQPGGLLSQSVNNLGQTVQRTLDASGNILERTLDSAGNVLSSRSIGRSLDLPVVRRSTNAAGQSVRQVRDTSGALIELTLDGAGNLVASRVLEQAPQRRR